MALSSSGFLADRATCAAALIIGMVLSAGCGGATTSTPKGPTSQAAPSAADGLVFAFAPADGDGTEGAASSFVKEALLQAGYVLEDGPEGADATLQVSVDATERESLIKMQVNGKQLRSYDFAVTLAAVDGGRTVDQHTVRFSGDDGEIDERALGLLVPQLNASKRFARLCETATRHRSDRVVQEKEATAAKARAEAEEVSRQDDLAWSAAKPLPCKSPATLSACDGVRAYAASHPGGRHAEEARELLTGAAPRLEALQEDENAWTTAQADVCRRAPSRDTCAGVEIYKVKFEEKGGLHLAEADELLQRAKVAP